MDPVSKIKWITVKAPLGTTGTAQLEDVDSAGWQVATLVTTGTDATDLFSFEADDDATYWVDVHVVGVDTDDYANQAGAHLSALFENDGGTLAQVGATQGSVVESAGGTNIAFAVDNTNDRIRVQVTGTASTAGFKWVGKIQVTKVTG